MKPKDGESYQDWIERARMYEHGVALQRIAQGQDPIKVMEDMSRRLMDKMLHPLYKAVSQSALTEFDAEQNRRNYEEHYLKNRKPVADHVDGNLFDKND